MPSGGGIHTIDKALATEHLLRGARHIAFVGGVEGRAVVSSLKVVGFDDIEFDDIEDCGQVVPALSSLRCDFAGFARRMAETVRKWLEADDRPPPETITPDTLIPRTSSQSR